MYIAHSNGHPVIVKTPRGDHWVGFTSEADGQMYLRWKEVLCGLGTLEEILRLNPNAFPARFMVLHLASRDLIESLLRYPQKFEVEEHLVELAREVPSPLAPAPALRPAKDTRQLELKLQPPSLFERLTAMVARRLHL